MKSFLFSPGPTPLPPEVQRAMAEPLLYHRAPAFAEVMGEVRKGLQEVFQTKQDVLILASSGTGAMEASIANLTSPTDTIISIEAGKFGERWGEIGRGYGLNVVTDRYEYGEACDVARVKKLLEANPQARLVCVQACETSTGVMHPVKELAQLVKQYPKTALVVDAITGIGIYDLPMDAWGIDALISGSQKALMVPPGLSFIALSEKAWGLQKDSKQPRYYFDLAKEQKSQAQNQNAYTPAISLIVALKESLALLRKETLPAVFERHARMAGATRAAAQAIGLKLFTKGPAANGLSAFESPAGIESGLIVKHMRNQLNITIAGGQGTMKGKIFRLAHMGYCVEMDVMGLLSALEETLIALGYKNFTPGTAVAAAQKSLSQEKRS